MQFTGNDVAVMWSFTESAMRQKALNAQLAQLKHPQDQIFVPMAAATGSSAGPKSGQVLLNPYSVGGNYRAESDAVYEAMERAGYTPQIIEDRLIPRGALNRYKALVIFHQTFQLPTDIMQGIAQFQKAGGTVIVDRGTTVEIPGSVRVDGDCDDHGFRLTLAQTGLTNKPEDNKAWSYLRTNYFVDEQMRNAAPAFKRALQKSAAKPTIVTDNYNLGAIRQEDGDGALYMVESGYEELPDVGATGVYPPYNCVPYHAKFTLGAVKPGSVAYAVEGLDWDHISRIDPTKPIDADFAAGEMKLYFVLPHAPGNLKLNVNQLGHALQISARVVACNASWPLTIAVTDPSGASIYQIYRATDETGHFSETLPLGSNAPSGKYLVSITSPLSALGSRAALTYKPAALKPVPLSNQARVFDADAIGKMLRSNQMITIAIGSESQRQNAQKLAAMLSERGVKTVIALEDTIMHKRTYPTVWDAYLTTYQPGGPQKQPTAPVLRSVTLDRGDFGEDVAVDSTGKPVTGWESPGTFVTVGPRGWADLNPQGLDSFYYPGMQFFVASTRQFEHLNAKIANPDFGDRIFVQSTDAEKAKWARPWADGTLAVYNGGFSLVPQLPEAWIVDQPLILLGSSADSQLVRALQASGLLPEIVDEKYPGQAKSIITYAWSPFALEKDVVLIGATDDTGVQAGIDQLVRL